MATAIVLPKLGMTMLEGTITEWYAQPGDQVSPGDLLFAFETEKVNYDAEAEAAGTLHVLVETDATVDAGTVVAYLLAAGEQPPTADADVPTPAVAPSAAPTTTTAPAPAATALAAPSGAGASGNGAGGEPGRASPAVKRLAAEHDVALASLSGSGVGGRILREDVIAAATSTPAPASAATTRAAPGGPIKASPAAKRLAREHGIDLAGLIGSGPEGRIVAGDVQIIIVAGDIESALAAPASEPPPAAAPVSAAPGAIPFRGIRRTIAARMHASLQTMAQLTMAMEVDMTRAVALRQELLELWQDRDLRPTYTDFVIKAAALALREHPRVNAELQGDPPSSVVVHPQIHVGFAVSLDEGLIVPVTRDTDRIPLDQLAPLTADLAARARADQLSPDDLTGGTFTVTSLGMYGVDVFTPIINPPQAAILGVGRIADRPVFSGETGTDLERRSFMTLSLTIDHRILDGAPGADFIGAVKHILEHPSQLLLS